LLTGLLLDEPVAAVLEVGPGHLALITAVEHNPSGRGSLARFLIPHRSAMKPRNTVSGSVWYSSQRSRNSTGNVSLSVF